MACFFFARPAGPGHGMIFFADWAGSHGMIFRRHYFSHNAGSSRQAVPPGWKKSYGTSMVPAWLCGHGMFFREPMWAEPWHDFFREASWAEPWHDFYFARVSQARPWHDFFSRCEIKIMPWRKINFMPWDALRTAMETELQGSRLCSIALFT